MSHGGIIVNARDGWKGYNTKMTQKHFYSSRDEEHGDVQILQIGVAMANLRHLLSHFTVSISACFGKTHHLCTKINI